MNGARWFFSFSLFLFLTNGVFADGVSLSPSPAPPVSHVTVDLVSESDSLIPDHTQFVGLRFLIEKEWHLYWRNPGDSGEAPRVIWHLPPGIEPGEIQWPTPQRIQVGPLVNFGYDNTLLLMVPLKVSEKIKGSVDLRADVKWLVCRDSCIPGKASLSLHLPVSNSPQFSPLHDLFQKTRESLPQSLPSGWKVTAEQDDSFLKVLWRRDPSSSVPGIPLPPPTAPAFFFPAIPNQIENAAPQRFFQSGQEQGLELKKSDQLNTPLSQLEGVLTLGDHAYVIRSDVKVAGGIAGAKALAPADPSLLTFFASLFAAFLGGLILNVMPCVFPVLSLKALHLLEQFRKESSAPFFHGLIYTAGVLVSFWILAFAIVLVRSGGESLGWGFQLQSPHFVAILASILLVMSLQLLGVFEFGSSLMGIGSSAAARENYVGSFVTGVLATVVATPCTAPFMGTAMAYAMNQPVGIVWGVFTSLGLGLAAPFCAISFMPWLGRYLPKPGRWMETFKQAMAFPMLATVIWLSWVYGIQQGTQGMTTLLSGFLLLGMAAWFLGRWSNGVSRGMAGMCVAGAFWILLAQPPEGLERMSSGSTTSWQPFSRDKVQELVQSGKPVLIDFTAAWCVTCQVNEKLAFTSEVMQAIRNRGIVPIRADWTRGDPEITQVLEQYHRNGVPLYVLLTGKSGDSPRILPQILTPQIVLDAIQELK